ARRLAVDLEWPVDAVVDDVPDEVRGTAEDRLWTHAAGRHVETTVVEDADVVHRAIGLEAVVVDVVDVVVVDVDRDRHPIARRLRIPVWHAIRRVIERVVKAGHAVVGHDVSRTIDRDRVVRLQLSFLLEAGLARPGPLTEPTEHGVMVLAAAP